MSEDERPAVPPGDVPAEPVLTGLRGVLDRCTVLAGSPGVRARLDLVGSLEELVVAAQVAQARELARLDVHEAADLGPYAVPGPSGLVGTVPGPDAVTPHEVAAHLGLTVDSTRTRLAIARTLTTDLPGITRAAETGQLHWWQARRAAEAAWQLPDRLHPALDARLSQLAGQGRLRSRFGAQLGRLVIALDPDLAETRLRRAVADREVRVRPDQEAPGMGVLIASLPAEGAITVAACLDRLADTPLAAPPDGTPAAGRSVDARRADALVGLAAAVLDALHEHPGVSVPDLAAAVLTAAGSAAAAGDQVGVPGAGSGLRPRRAGRRRSGEVRVTMSVETLLGIRDHPGDLAGWGPITPGHARRLAGREGTEWRRILTDPTSGSVLDVGRTRYTPTAAITEHVLARDGGRCTRPWCTRTARDLDHATAWNDGGSTATSNLHAVCRGCHTVKHLGWTIHVVDGQSITWRTPHGLVSSQPLPDLRPEDRMPQPPSAWVADVAHDLRPPDSRRNRDEPGNPDRPDDSGRKPPDPDADPDEPPF